MKNSTMIATITRSTLTDTGLYCMAQCGGKAATIGITETYVTVVAITAATRHGYGRTFHGENAIAQCLEAYRSPQMKAMILAADALNK